MPNLNSLSKSRECLVFKQETFSNTKRAHREWTTPLIVYQVKPVAWLQRYRRATTICFVVFCLLAIVSVIATLRGHEAGFLFAFCFCLAMVLPLSIFVAVYFCRCSTCGARLKPHWGKCCEWEPGKQGDRLLLECSFCRVLWDAGKWGRGSTTPG